MELNPEIADLLPLAIAGSSFIAGGLVSKFVQARYGSLGKYWPLALAVVFIGWACGAFLVPALTGLLVRLGLPHIWSWAVSLVFCTFVSGFAFFVVMQPKKKANDGNDAAGAER